MVRSMLRKAGCENGCVVVYLTALIMGDDLKSTSSSVKEEPGEDSFLPSTSPSRVTQDGPSERNFCTPLKCLSGAKLPIVQPFWFIVFLKSQ